MPKRVLDFDAMWGSDKLASCAEWAQAEYAWFYGLADASGCFELTNLRVIWGRVAAVRRNLTIERLEQIFGEFQDKGLLFVWEHEGKRYGHWTGSDVPGRLPPPSWRMRLERLAPPVPKQLFAEYVSRFARGRAALPGGAFRGEVDRGVASRGESESSRVKIENVASSSRAALESHGGMAARSSLESQSVLTRPLSAPEGGDAQTAAWSAAGDRDGRQQDLQLDHGDGEQATLPNQRSVMDFLDTGSKSAGKRPGVHEAGGLRALKDILEVNQTQDWNLNLDLDRNQEGETGVSALLVESGCEMTSPGRTRPVQTAFSDSSLSSSATSDSQTTSSLDLNTNSALELTLNSKANSRAPLGSSANSESRSHLDLKARHSSSADSCASGEAERVQESGASFPADANRAARMVVASAGGAATHFRSNEKSVMVARELAVGRGPFCGPVRVKPEVLERIRARDAARNGTRSP